MEQKTISIKFINPPFEKHFHVFETFLNKNSIVKGVDGIYRMVKTEKMYRSFLKKLFKFAKKNDIQKWYKRFYGARLEDNQCEIIFEDHEDKSDTGEIIIEEVLPYDRPQADFIEVPLPLDATKKESTMDTNELLNSI